MTHQDAGPRQIAEALTEYEQAMELRGAMSPTLRRLGRCHELAAARKLERAGFRRNRVSHSTISKE